MPKPRYTVRAGAHRRYSVWDNETDKVATSPSGDREYSDLGFNEAFGVADQLALAQQSPPQQPQQAAQQQQQPQPDDDKDTKKE